MGLFDVIKNNRIKKDIDKKIDEAQQLLTTGSAVSAFLLLEDIPKGNTYRRDEIRWLLKLSDEEAGRIIAKKGQKRILPAKTDDSEQTEEKSEEEKTEETAETAPRPQENSENTEKAPQAEAPDSKDGRQWFEEGMAFYHDSNYTDALRCMKNAAQLGVPEAMANTAIMYHTGTGTQQDEQKSAYWHLKAAEAGIHKSMAQLSQRYYHGEGVEKDHAKALYWAEKAAESDNPEYWFNLAHKYGNCEGTERDEKKEFMRLEKAAQGGVEEAYIYCGHRYSSGYGTEKDVAKALYWYEKAARTGNAEAMFECYGIYCDKDSVLFDKEKAAHWLNEAYKAESPDAVYEVANIRLRTESDPQNIRNTYAVLEKLAENGHVKSMARLAEEYYAGNEKAGIEPDPERRLYWFEKVAQATMEEKFVGFLCQMYTDRDSPYSDVDKGGYWLSKAIEHKYPEPLFRMGVQTYRYAQEYPDLYEDALDCFRHAAGMGHEEALRLIGNIYMECIRAEVKKGEAGDMDKVYEMITALMDTQTYERMTDDGKAEILYQAGVLRNGRKKIITASKYMVRSAELDNTKAMNWLGDYYNEENNPNRDVEKALYWYETAGEKLDGMACLRAVGIYRGMRAQQSEAAGYVMKSTKEKFVYWLEKAMQCDDESVRELAEKALKEMKENGFLK